MSSHDSQIERLQVSKRRWKTLAITLLVAISAFAAFSVMQAIAEQRMIRAKLEEAKAVQAAAMAAAAQRAEAAQP